MKTVLITGSNGLLGQKLVRQLQKDPNYKLIATSKGKNRIRSITDFIYESLDITSISQVKGVFEKYQPDVLINTAAMTNVDACEEDKEGCWKMNVTAVAYLLEECKKYNTHFIHLSTDFVFDGENGPYSESDLPKPLSYYGESKFASEKVIQNSEHKNWAIARTIIVYGLVEQMSRSNIVLWAKGALEKGDPINVVDDQFRSPTLAVDLAKGCILIADKQAKGVYHLSGKDLMSILELVNRVADFFKLDKSSISAIKSITLNQTAKRPPKTGFVLDKAIRELGYDPATFEEGLAIVSQELELVK
jgi:dTDP-4-dehydrorhamnose reductase|tara:strand:- start:10 stop:921 length:912 start_codon:yes stop_codon:yes gene_type:complete